MYRFSSLEDFINEVSKCKSESNKLSSKLTEEELVIVMLINNFIWDDHEKAEIIWDFIDNLTKNMVKMLILKNLIILMRLLQRWDLRE